MQCSDAQAVALDNLLIAARRNGYFPPTDVVLRVELHAIIIRRLKNSGTATAAGIGAVWLHHPQSARDEARRGWWRIWTELYGTSRTTNRRRAVLLRLNLIQGCRPASAAAGLCWYFRGDPGIMFTFMERGVTTAS